jgi:hypothetical protein
MGLGDCLARDALLARGRSSPHASNLKVALGHEREAIPAWRDDQPVEQPTFATDR